MKGIKSHEDLRRYLQLHGLARAWYAMYWRAFQVNGRITALATFSHPYEAADRFHEFLIVMATAGGKPPRYPGVDYSTAEIAIIPDRLLAADPREAMAELASGGRATDPPRIPQPADR
jgi:hypothetical protein